jgi:hypothetical protein
MATYILTAAQLNNRILNSFSIPSSGGSVDPDAQAFITAAGITDPTQQSAINTLVVGLKDDGLWTNMQALYPFVGGTATQHKYNLKDPRDLDAAYRLSFSGGWTHNADGITGNGVNTYADTFYNSPNSFGVYSRTFNASYPWMTGIQEYYYIDGDFSEEFKVLLTGNQLYVVSYNNYTAINTDPPHNKFYSVIRNPFKFYRNGISATSQVPLLPTSTINFVLGAIRNRVYNDGILTVTYVQGYGSSNIAFAYYSATNLNATQNTNLNNRVVAFQTELSRQV